MTASPADTGRPRRRHTEGTGAWRVRLLVATFVAANVAAWLLPNVPAARAASGVLQGIRLLCGLPG